MKNEVLNVKVPQQEQDLFNALYKKIHIDGQIMCLGQLLDRSAHLYPDNIALIWQDRSITYKELYYRASLLSTTLRQMGLKPRDRVLLFFENSFEFYIGYFAVVQAGGVIAPLNTFLHENELRHIVHDAQPTFIITASVHVELFKKVQADTIAQLVTESSMDLVSEVPTTIARAEITKLDPEEMAALLYTSGTTGLPKGVMLSSKNIMTNTVQGMSRSPQDHERILGVLPLFHSFAQNVCVWSSIFSGFTVILIPKIDRRYLVQGLSHKPTILFGVPALYGFFCLMRTAQFPDIKMFVSGGDVLPDKIRAGFELLYRRRICNGYGLTEATPFVSVDLQDVTEPTSCIGHPLVGIDVAIIDEHEQRLPQGEIGHLILKGDNIMLGYYNAPDMTAATIKDGWLYTGDLAYLDQNGKIVITGRIKDLIIHKGFNIYPPEIENVILSYANAIRVGVVGKRGNDGEEFPVAFVQIRVEEPGIEQALKKLCVQQLASYKVPREFYVTTEDMVTTSTGKVDKKVLRAKLEKA